MAERFPFHADPILIEALTQYASPFPCTEVRVLFRQGEKCCGLFILHGGRATLEMRSETGQIVARFITEDGSLLGMPAALADAPYSLTAIAVQGSNVSFIERKKFLEVMASDSALSFKALQVMAAETRAARAALVDALARQRR